MTAAVRDCVCLVHVVRHQSSRAQSEMLTGRVALKGVKIHKLSLEVGHRKS